MKRAHAAGARCLRECPVLVTMDDGTLAEGVADLAFEEQIGGQPRWTVVDFKTDVEIGGHLAQYRAQLEIYMRGIAQSTGRGRAASCCWSERFQRAASAGPRGFDAGWYAGWWWLRRRFGSYLR